MAQRERERERERESITMNFTDNQTKSSLTLGKVSLYVAATDLIALAVKGQKGCFFLIKFL